MTPQQRALEMVYAGRMNRKGPYYEVPTSVFFDKIDVGMPALPPIAFYRVTNPDPDLAPFSSKTARAKDEDVEVEQIRAAAEPCSPLALSLHKSIWVKEDEIGALRAFAEGLILRNGTVPMETLRRSAILVCEDLFENPTPENIQKSVKMVGSFVYVIMKDPKAYALLSRLSSHDPYTLQHSVGTAVHCVILGRKLGTLTESELTDLGAAGLMHDLGKTSVKREIINKNGPLDEHEWEEMRGHPEAGYEIVKNNPSISMRTKLAILEHHEDKHGKGYPFGKRTSDIDLFSRVVALCDTFNALTTDRTYSKARTPFEALQFMREKLSHKIDDEMFRSLVMIYGGKLD
jgi:HD-GYP domain-containing protein (c-di-GMP phosphodiesterase class II)